MMSLVMTGRYHPVADRPMNEGARKHLPSHVIDDAHQGHDRQDDGQHRDMDGY
jgi:hypothetical protein